MRPATRILLAVLACIAAVAAVLPAGPPAWAQDSAPFHAEPTWISNTGVHRDGEFVYDDYVYDDHGPDTDGVNRRDLPFGLWPDPSTGDLRMSPTGGSIRYAGDYLYAADGDEHLMNVADLIRWRVAPDDDAVRYRFLLGALAEPDDAIIGMCIDTDRDASTGIGVLPDGVGLDQDLGCDAYVTTTGTEATIHLPQGTTMTPIAGGTTVEADTDANTITLTIPRSVLDPAGATWRYTVFSGVHDKDSGGWLAPAPGPQVVRAPTATGGGDGSAPLIWDLLSNNDEPNSYQREERQAHDLAAHDIAAHHVDVDFGRLAAGTDDPDPRPTGVFNRIYRSAHEVGAGEGLTIDGSNWVYEGRYQPYAMALPSDYWTTLDADPDATFPFDLCMHPLNGSYMVEIYYAQAFADESYNPLITGTTWETGQLGYDVFEARTDELGGIYGCVLGRGEGVGYTGGIGLVDVLEVKRDIESHYAVDPDKRTVHGVSLGAIGTFYVAPLYPDQYAAAMPYIFSPSIASAEAPPRLQNLYNVFTFNAIGTLDQFGQGTQGDPTADAMEEYGNEYVYLHYVGRQHEGRIAEDVSPFVDALAYPRERVDDPARVRFHFDPSLYNELEPHHGSAYWVDGIEPRDDAPATVDVTSLARADALPTHQVIFDGEYSLPSENFQARIRGLLRMSEEEFAEFWDPAAWEEGWQELNLSVTPSELEVPEVANGFTATLDNVGTLELDTTRMALDTGAVVTGELDGAGATTLVLHGAFPAGTTATLDGEPVAVERAANALTVTVELGSPHTLVIAPPGAAGDGASTGGASSERGGGGALPATGGGLALVGLLPLLAAVLRRRS